MKKSRSGFTLAEVLISIAITSILGLTVYKFMSSANKNAAITRCRGMLRQNAQIAARQLERDISSSRAVIDNEDNDKRAKMTLEIGTPAGPTIVSMQTSIIDADDSAVNYFDSNDGESDQEKELYEDVTYTLNNGVLMREGSKKKFKVADNVASISFATNEIDNIDVSYDGKIEFTIETSAKPDGSPEKISHREQVIVAIRQLQSKMLQDRDPRQNAHWKQRIDAGNY